MAHSVRALLEDDDYRRATRWLRADLRLATEAALAVLDEPERLGANATCPTPEMAAQLRAYLVRCAAGTLDDVAPLDAETIDPQVVAMIADDLHGAEDAEASFAAGGGQSALDASIHAWRRVLDAPILRSAYPGLRAALCNDAAGTYLRRFWAGGERDDLHAAQALFGAAVVLTPEQSARCAHRLANQAVASRENYLRFGETAALDLAEQALRHAVAVLRRSSSAATAAVTGVMTDLALVQRDRHLAGVAGALDEGIAVAKRAAESDSVGARVMLADLLSLRAARDGTTDDLDRAVELLTEAVRVTPAGSADRPRRCVDLAITLTEVFAVRGELEDLDQAIRLCVEAVDLLPAASPDAPHAHAQLAAALYRRFEAAGHLDDLDRAIALLDRVVDDAPPGEIAASGWRVNLATALIQRGRRTERLPDLDRAVSILDRSLTGAEGSADRYTILNNLGNALRERGRRQVSRDDLDGAVDRLRDALTLTAAGTARRCTTLTNLAVALRDRHRLLGRRSDLDEAVGLAVDAVESGADSDVDTARRYFAYALIAQDYAEVGVYSAHRAADHAYRRGCAVGVDIDPESTLVAAQDWASWAAGGQRWTVATEAFEIAMTAASNLVRTQVERSHQELWLRTAAGTAPSAAYAARADGRLSLAVMMLERGRAALLSEALGALQADLEALTHQHSHLAARYRNAVALLQARTAPHQHLV